MPAPSLATSRWTQPLLDFAAATLILLLPLLIFLRFNAYPLLQQGQYPGSSNNDLPFVLHLILDEYPTPESLDQVMLKHSFPAFTAGVAGKEITP